MKKVKDLKKGDTCFLIDLSGSSMAIKVKNVEKNTECDFCITYEGDYKDTKGYAYGEQNSTSYGTLSARAYTSKEDAINELEYRQKLLNHKIEQLKQLKTE